MVLTSDLWGVCKAWGVLWGNWRKLTTVALHIFPVTSYSDGWNRTQLISAGEVLEFCEGNLLLTLSMMVIKWCKTLKRCLIFQGHLSKFNVTTVPNIANFIPISVFRDDNASFNSEMAMTSCAKLWGYRCSVLLFFEIVCTISRSQGPENCKFGPHLWRITLF